MYENFQRENTLVVQSKQYGNKCSLFTEVFPLLYGIALYVQHLMEPVWQCMETRWLPTIDEWPPYTAVQARKLLLVAMDNKVTIFLRQLSDM